MPSSKQTPLTSPRGRSVHDFSQRLVDWEASVFDDAEYFAVVEMRFEERGYGHTRFEAFPDAVRRAEASARVTLHAVSSSGRFALLDREKWPEWERRWREG